MNIFDDINESLVNYFTELTTNYQYSNKWKEYNLGATLTHCLTCFKRNNKIYLTKDVPLLPEHERCACFLNWLRKISIGNATTLGKNGVDYYLYTHGILPSNYITKEEAYSIGWKPILGNLDKVAPGKTIGGNIFNNREDKLPSVPGRIWYECDIDYNGGYRNNYRLIYSNDGLMFKTDSHYARFIAVE